jgi:hypothetical protein
MRRSIRWSAGLAVALVLFGAALQAQGRPGGRGAIGPAWHGHGHWHGGHRAYWGLGLGIGLGIGLGAPLYYAPYGPYYGGTLLVAPPPLVYGEPVPPVAPMAQPDPIFYPRNGQSPAQTEADRQACNRWAISQPSAMADASVFQRATLACMEGRGYTVR